MPTRTPPSRTAATRPLIDSPFALRVLATGIALSTFTGMSAFAAAHVQNAAAPLQPPATTIPATPAPTSVTRRTTTLGAGIGTTTAPARTRTRSS